MITADDINKIIADNYGHCLDSLARISLDEANNKSMINCPVRFHNYDRIGTCVFKNNDKKPKTPDMVFIKNDTVYFVEFKNGKIGQHVKLGIKLKALEGAFIVLHQLVLTHKKEGVKIDFSHIIHLKKAYILVYNEDEEPIKTSGEKRIYGHLVNSRIRFGLHMYKGTFFYDVATYIPETFKIELQRILQLEGR